MAIAACAWAIRARGFIAEDSYFYLVAARRLALEGHQSFSGVFPSNGFHPLWLYLLAGWSWVVGRIDPELLWRVNHAAPLSVLLLALGAWLFVRVERELQLAPGTLVLPPLVFVTVLGVLYSEAHALFAALGWIALLIVWILRGRHVGGWHFGLAAAVLTLARLDAAFLAGLALVWALHRVRERRFAILSCLVAGIIAGLYIGSNVWFFGGPVPISGWLKSSAPVATPSGWAGAWHTLSLSDYAVPYGVIPVSCAVGVWVLFRGAPVASLLGLFTGGSVAHMGYTMLFASYCGWNWYYVLPVVTGALAAAAVIRTFASRAAWVGAAVPVLMVLFAAAGVSRAIQRDNRTESMRAIQQHLSDRRLDGKTVFVSELPGEAAFLGRANVIAADMLTANLRLYTAVKAAPDAWQHLQAYCRARGAPIEEIVYVGGAFVAWDGADGLTWIDPKVSSARPLARIPTGGRRVWRPDVPFAVWSAVAAPVAQDRSLPDR